MVRWQVCAGKGYGRKSGKTAQEDLRGLFCPLLSVVPAILHNVLIGLLCAGMPPAWAWWKKCGADL